MSITGSNPNNCATCRWKQIAESDRDGWCHMFRDEPTETCMQHSGREYKPSRDGIAALLAALHAENGGLTE